MIIYHFISPGKKKSIEFFYMIVNFGIVKFDSIYFHVSYIKSYPININSWSSAQV